MTDTVNGLEEGLRTDGASVAKEPLINADGTPTPRGWRKIGELLRKPMQTRERKGPGGRMLAYITARDVQNRLDGVVGVPASTSSARSPGSSSARSPCAAPVALMLATPNAPDSEDEMEPARAVYSDALNRAAVGFGIGRWL